MEEDIGVILTLPYCKSYHTLFNLYCIIVWRPFKSLASSAQKCWFSQKHSGMVERKKGNYSRHAAVIDLRMRVISYMSVCVRVCSCKQDKGELH